MLAQGLPDLVLLDWEMPVMNGPETLVEICRRHPGLPIVMMTSRNAPEEIFKMMTSGASEYIMKPFTADILAEKVERILGRSLDAAA
jgi:DNA-binding response OmpR family regulator